jgi:hypothetical protein
MNLNPKIEKHWNVLKDTEVSIRIGSFEEDSINVRAEK